MLPMNRGAISPILAIEILKNVNSVQEKLDERFA
jgi:hypothetical protein